MKAKYQQRQVWRAEMEVCAWCGKDFLKRTQKQKFCCHTCAKKAARYYDKMENRIAEKCRVIVVQNIPLYQHLIPTVGSIYDAIEYTLPAGAKGCWIKMCGKRIALRQGEYRRLEEC